MNHRSPSRWLTAGTGLVLILAAAQAASLAAGGVPFIENDYPTALQDARTRKVPLFVDVWAPW